MNIIKLILGSYILLSLTTNTIFASENNAKQEGMQAIKLLGKSLKSTLQKELKKDPSGLSALKVCKDEATNITNQINSQLPTNITVRRTSLKLRNSNDNFIDETDKKVLKELKNSIKVIKVGDTTRIYKPLITTGVCMKCHGQNISTALKNAIKNAYPHDQAVGFKVGSLRGAVVAEVK